MISPVHFRSSSLELKKPSPWVRIWCGRPPGRSCSPSWLYGLCGPVSVPSFVRSSKMARMGLSIVGWIVSSACLLSAIPPGVAVDFVLEGCGSVTC